jgi:hypothetical protein
LFEKKKENISIDSIRNSFLTGSYGGGVVGSVFVLFIYILFEAYFQGTRRSSVQTGDFTFRMNSSPYKIFLDEKLFIDFLDESKYYDGYMVQFVEPSNIHCKSYEALMLPSCRVVVDENVNKHLVSDQSADVEQKYITFENEVLFYC